MSKIDQKKLTNSVWIDQMTAIDDTWTNIFAVLSSSLRSSSSFLLWILRPRTFPQKKINCTINRIYFSLFSQWHEKAAFSLFENPRIIDGCILISIDLIRYVYWLQNKFKNSPKKTKTTKTTKIWKITVKKLQIFSKKFKTVNTCQSVFFFLPKKTNNSYMQNYEKKVKEGKNIFRCRNQ